MSGLVETPDERTTSTPFYREMEQDENVAKGCIKVTEIIVYDPAGTRKDEEGIERPVEKARRPYYCQDREDLRFFESKNPNSRIETFTIQLLKSTAVKYLNDPENAGQFRRNE